MNADQRFASQRPDVLTYQTDILTEDITALGPVMVDLFVGLSTTDADFVVKVIDVFPDDFKEYKSEATPMGGYQMLVRGEIFRVDIGSHSPSQKRLNPVNRTGEVRHAGHFHTFKRDTESWCRYKAVGFRYSTAILNKWSIFIAVKSGLC
jgi:hypothetical protein